MKEAGADVVVTSAKDAVEAIEKLLAEAPVTRDRRSKSVRAVRLQPDSGSVRLTAGRQRRDRASQCRLLRLAGLAAT